jgi:hypothetical protein
VMPALATRTTPSQNRLARVPSAWRRIGGVIKKRIIVAHSLLVAPRRQRIIVAHSLLVKPKRQLGRPKKRLLVRHAGRTGNDGEAAEGENRLLLRCDAHDRFVRRLVAQWGSSGCCS